MLQPDDGYLTVDSIRTRYWQVGESGTPVLLIHGIGGSIEGFLPILELLAAHHRVFTFDLPGYGLTDIPANFPYDIPAFTGFITRFMDCVGLQRAHVVGHSLGGALAVNLTMDYPEKVDRLVLMSSAGLGREMALIFRLPVIPLIGEWLTRPAPPRRESQKAFAYDISVLDDRAMQIDYEHSQRPGAQQALLKILRKNVNLFGLKNYDARSMDRKLRTIQSPVLIIWGRYDEIVPLKHGEDAVRKIPNAQLHVLERCKHLPMIEKTAEVNQLLSEFLD